MTPAAKEGLPAVVGELVAQLREEVFSEYGTRDDCRDQRETVRLFDELESTLSALTAEAGKGEESPEDRFEHYVQTAIAKSPEPLRQLGEYLSRVLDEDEFPNADRLLLQVATKSDDLEWLEQEIQALECRHHGDPSYDHDAYWMKREVLKLLQTRKARAGND